MLDFSTSTRYRKMKKLNQTNRNPCDRQFFFLYVHTSQALWPYFFQYLSVGEPKSSETVRPCWVNLIPYFSVSVCQEHFIKVHVCILEISMKKHAQISYYVSNGSTKGYGYVCWSVSCCNNHLVMMIIIIKCCFWWSRSSHRTHWEKKPRGSREKNGQIPYV